MRDVPVCHKVIECPRCKGSCKDPVFAGSECIQCGGSGTITI